MRTEISYYYSSKGLVPRKSIYQKLNKIFFKHKLNRIDVGSEKWIKLQYKLANLSSDNFDCEKREIFYKYSCASCGKDLCIMPYTIMSYTKNISFGDKVFVNTHSMLVAKDKIIIGNNVLIGPNVIINSGMHNYGQANKTIQAQGHKKAPIIIEDDVWIGANVLITPGVTIGKGAVIGANSFVNKSVESYTVVAGSPIRIISKRNL